MKIILLALYDEWSLGLRLLSAILKKEGHHVVLAVLKSFPEMHGEEGKDDPEGYHAPPASVPGADFQALLELVGGVAPDLIGIGFASSFSGLAADVTRRLRTVSKAPIVYGGVDSSANPDSAIQFADIVCVGEGERAIVDLTRRLAAGQPYHDIPNLWVRKDGEVFRNDVRPLLTDLDSLPFADFEYADQYWISGGRAHRGEHHPASNLHTTFPILTTRGCPYSCSYCCNSMYRQLYGSKDYIRMRSVDSVIAELRGYISRHPKTQWVHIFDDVFGVDVAWAEAFAERYAREVALPFWCFTYPAFIKPRLVAALKKAGVTFVVMGIQSGSQRMLKDIYHRNTPPGRVIEAARMISEAGITLLVDLIDGYPFTTEEDNWQTLELMLKLPQGFILQPINPLTLYRNYPLMELAERQGLGLPLMPGRNDTVAPASDFSRFWTAILTLTQFASMPAETLRLMARDAQLRQQPEAVEAIAAALADATYVPGTRVPRAWQDKERLGELERLRVELITLRSSRLVRLALRLRDWLAASRPPRPAPSAPPDCSARAIAR